MEIRQLQYFIEVAEREHVSEAALALHVAQSAVSRQIANLETELGVELFEREGRNIKLSPVGRLFLQHAKSAIKAIEHAKKQIDEYLDPERGTIKIGFPTSLAGQLLPTVVSAFKREHPNIAFHLRQGSYQFLTESVKNGDIDLAFLGPVPKNDPDLEGNILFTEKISALLPDQHPLSEKRSILLNDLRNDDFVLFPEGYILREVVVNACKESGFLPKIACEGEDLDAIKGLVTAGMGVTLLPDSSISETKPRFTVKVPIEIPDVRRTVGLITPRGRELAPAEQVFYEFVIHFFSVLEQYK
ncbi:LysR family transcriptional regulator [Fictibacillus barbaricus]|uniref:LysR family transcriptional activator of glutamate synthase operon n=1 Tax=Fictibacillus barbaricus TaxID=182136 RepID=A0ABU1TYW6_9BACL|nr:LysR family transcriptional regulator [Fictibacillus barbaricus]MDR7072376.1 LysR family transcriptional activator of glutamate synthase operon [Fictibacillus barbaricus]